MSFGDETGDYSSGNYRSVDSKKFNNKLNIESFEDTDYAEFGVRDGTRGENSGELLEDDKMKQPLTKKLSVDSEDLPIYASVDMKKKQDLRREKSLKTENDTTQLNNLNQSSSVYEDIGTDEKINNDESNIYELVSFNDVPVVEVYSEVHDNYDENIYAEI